jgi:hypothetical protein
MQASADDVHDTSCSDRARCNASMVPRNASHVRSRPPPPPLLPLEPVPLVVGLVTVSPVPLEVLPLEVPLPEVPPLDVVVPVPGFAEGEPLDTETVSRHDAVCTSVLICPRLQDENWLLKLMVGAIR